MDDFDAMMPFRPSEEATSTALSTAEQFVTRSYLIDLSNQPVVPIPDIAKTFRYDKMFEITRIVYDPEEGINDKLVSIYSAIYNMGSTLRIVVDSSPDGTRLFIGTRDAKSPSTAGNLLEKALRGHFPGIGLNPIPPSTVRTFFEDTIPEDFTCKSLAAVSVVPSQREEKEQNFIQGIEKFIESMQGETYTAVFIAEPINKDVLMLRKNGFEQLSTAISKFATLQMNFSQSDSDAVALGLTENFSRTIGESVSHTTSKNETLSRGTSFTRNRGTSFTVPLFGLGWNSGTARATTDNSAYSEGTSTSSSENTSETVGDSYNTSRTKTSSSTNAVTLTITDRRVQSLTDQIDCHLERIQDCESFGMWDGAAYFISDSNETAFMAANTYKALVSGDNTNVENAFVNLWGGDSESQVRTLPALQYVRYGMHPVFQVANETPTPQSITPASAISGMELPVFLGLPFKSISGVTSLPMAEFGRNVVELGTVGGNRKFKLGCINHMGVDNLKTHVTLKVNTLASHTFITGSSGTGKSNAVYHILKSLYSIKDADKDGNSSNVKFLVIEPAKGEYKDFFRGLPNLNILTVGQRGQDLLRINPFEFPDETMVLEHIDKLIEIFSACWPLYAAMPAILKSSFEKAYQSKGWDLKNSFYIGSNPSDKFPTFFDILEQLPLIINSSEYSAQSKGDYIGALVTRVASLTTGTIGGLFCDKYTVSDKVLFDENTIVDISKVGSKEVLSLIMGILVLKLQEYRSANATSSNVPIHHVTVLEEAHNILPYVNTDQNQESGNVQGKSVEMLCNAIAEMRTYGEGFIIADQTPSAVAKSAISNTSTKIIMRLADFDDCMTVGKSIGLKEPQIEEIGKLGLGIAVVYQSNWLEAVLTHVEKTDEVPLLTAEFCPDRALRKKQVISDLVTELVQQLGSDVYNDRTLKRIIESAERRPPNNVISRTRCISRLEKERYLKMIDSFIQSPKKRTIFSDLIVGLLECEDLMHAISPNLDAPAVKLSAGDRKRAKRWYKRIREVLDYYLECDEKDFIVAQLMYFIHEHTRLTIDGKHPNPDKKEFDLHVASKYILSLLF